MLEHFFHSEVFTITFVIGLYLINIKIHRWVQVPVLHSLLHPVLVTIIELILILTALKVPYETFREGAEHEVNHTAPQSSLSATSSMSKWHI